MRTAATDWIGIIEQVGVAGWAALATIVGTVIGWLSTRNKNKADVAQVLSQTSIDWIRELREEGDRLRARLEAFEGEVAECEERFDALVAYLVDMGLDPPPEALRHR